MDLPLYNVLEEIGCLEYIGYFVVKKWTRDKLLKTNDLKKVMEDVLPKKIPKRKTIIDKIIAELTNSVHDFRSAIKVKKEEENGVTIRNERIEESDGEVSIMEAENDLKDPEVLSINDDEEGDTDEQITISDVVAPNFGTSSVVQVHSHAGVRAVLSLTRSTGEIRAFKLRRATIVAKRARLQQPCGKEISMLPSENRIQTWNEPTIEFEKFGENNISKTMATLDSKVSNGNKTPTKSWSDWTRIFSQEGPNIDILVCKSWTWKPSNENCPLNLLNFLTEVCPQIEELCIQSECSFLSNHLSLNPQLELKNLKSLVINHDNQNGLLDYHEILSTIIMAAGGKLEAIVFLYQDEVALKRFLDILTNLLPEYLGNLNLLRIKRWDKWHIGLLESELLSLAKIKAKRLLELDLRLGFWDNVKLSFEKMLRRFAHLSFLNIHGCFVTGAEVEPTITIDFPLMLNLQELAMGQSYTFSTVFEDASTRPAKRKESISRIEADDENETRPRKRMANDLMEDENGSFFNVTLNFGLMSQLTHLNLGATYELHHLPFADMPKLRSFRVSSEWHFLSQFKERNMYPKIKELQIPDCFEDYSLLPRILDCFPKVEKVYMSLPTVTVIRGFSKYMEDVESFKNLVLKVQFDFESSIDSCFFEDPCSEPHSQTEAQKFRALKEYTHWKDYAAVNRIEVPDFQEDEDVLVVEDKTKFAGLHVLQKKLRNGLSISFLPRTLRLPKGDLHWNDDKCEFSDTIIGYRENEYIFTKKSWNKAPWGTKLYDFKLSQTTATPFTYDKTDHLFQCDPLITRGSKKEDEDNENSLSVDASQSNC